MEYRELGSTGLRLSKLGFGASPLDSVFGNVTQEDANDAVREALELGINFFDVSPYYGATLAEQVLGKALKASDVLREKYILSTKCGRYAEGFDFSAGRVVRSVDESLARLNVDYIDIIQCHDIEFGSLDQIILETIPALQRLNEVGKVRFIGITGLPLKIFKYILDRVEPGQVDVILSYCHYSLNDTSLVHLLPYLKEKGVGIISASPLSMGLLTEQGPPDWHPAPQALKDACASAANNCKQRGSNISQLALKFSLKNPNISSILVGMSSLQQVQENIKAAIQADLPNESYKEVENILKKKKKKRF